MSESNKSYGLIIKNGNKKGLVKKVPSVFGNESSSDDEVRNKKSVNKNITEESTKKMQMKQTKLEMRKALEEDSTVYEYDEVYDQMEENKKEAIVAKAQGDKKSKYISRLLKSSETRKLEEERRKERKIQKERQDEGEEYKDKEEFVTSSYRKKIEERAAEEERIRKQDELELANDVTKQKDLGKFYQNLLTNNISMGGSGNKNDDQGVKERKKDSKQDPDAEENDGQKSVKLPDPESSGSDSVVDETFIKRKNKKRAYRKVDKYSDTSDDDSKEIKDPMSKKTKTSIDHSSDEESDKGLDSIKRKALSSESSDESADTKPKGKYNKKQKNSLAAKSKTKKRYSHSSSDKEFEVKKKKKKEASSSHSSSDSSSELEKVEKKPKQGDKTFDKKNKENIDKKQQSKNDSSSSSENEKEKKKTETKIADKSKNIFTKRNTEEDIDAARERYLARKQELEDVSQHARDSN